MRTRLVTQWACMLHDLQIKVMCDQPPHYLGQKYCRRLPCYAALDSTGGCALSLKSRLLQSQIYVFCGSTDALPLSHKSSAFDRITNHSAKPPEAAQSGMLMTAKTSTQPMEPPKSTHCDLLIFRNNRPSSPIVDMSLSRRACYKCGNVGHYAEVCSSAERLCYNCQSTTFLNHGLQFKVTHSGTQANNQATSPISALCLGLRRRSSATTAKAWVMCRPTALRSA